MIIILITAQLMGLLATTAIYGFIFYHEKRNKRLMEKANQTK